MYAAAVGRPMPRIREAIIVSTRAASRFPPETVTTRVLNFSPRPVSEMTPMMIPAVAHATATGMTASTLATSAATNRRGDSMEFRRRKLAPIATTTAQNAAYMTE